MISSGAKRDLLVIGLCNALLMIRNSEDVKEDKHLTKLNNKSHKVNKKLDMELETLQRRLHDTQTKMYHASNNPTKLGKWVRGNLDTKITKVLRRLKKNTNLELLANQILFMNFCDRQLPLHKEYQWIAEESQHYKIFDLLGLTTAATVESETYEDAVISIEILRG